MPSEPYPTGRESRKLPPPPAGGEDDPLARHCRADHPNARRNAPGRTGWGGGSERSERLLYLQQTARDRKNVFSALMQAVKTHSLGQISHAIYEVGGEYRRNM